jgi:membrane-bound lytic murein transglycosylase D
MEKRLPMTCPAPALTPQRSLTFNHRAALICTLFSISILAGCATSTPYGTAPTTGGPTAPAPEVKATPAPAVVVAAPPVSAAASAPEAVAVGPAAAPVASVAAATAPADERVVVVPVDPLQPDAILDLANKSANVDLWARVRSGFLMPDLDSDLVRNREQWYATRPDYVQRMTERGGRYLFHIVEEVQRRGMPTELALLPFIESAFNPQAMSSAKASGMWQFMPMTGKHFSLKQNVFRDDRRDVLASTRAALDYLSKLHKMFGDWHLALAAYNWGEGSVQRAIKRNQAEGLPTDYLSLRMPDETRYYVPKLQAVKNIVAKPDAFGITLPALRNHPYFLSVPIARDIDVDIATKLSGVALDEFKTLNPQMNKPVILAAGTPQVLLPYDNANQFVHRLATHRGPLATWTAWVAPKTLHPSAAAKQVGMSEVSLREINRIPARMLVKAGSTLLVPRSVHRVTDVSEQIADNATMSLAPDVPPLKRVALRAGKRDTVASVANRYKVSAAQVALWNKVPATAKFKPGSTVVVFVPQKRGGKGVAARGGKGRSGKAVMAKGGKGGKAIASARISKTSGKAARKRR